MQTKRNRRAAIGATCLVIVALAMGWFVGQYIPGKPQAPESNPYENVSKDSGQTAEVIIDAGAGDTTELRGIVQGERFTWEARDPIVSIGETNERIPDDVAIENVKAMGFWEYECPSVDLRVTEAKVVSVQSFAEWYPDYKSLYKVIDDSNLIIATFTVTNRSDEPLENWDSLYGNGDLPSFTLWGDGLANINGDNLDSGLRPDGEAFYLINPRYAGYPPGFPSSGEPLSDEDLENLVTLYAPIAPGETKTLEVPFRISKNMLLDQSTFSDLSASDFCIQIPDYATSTMYRLWLE